MGEGSTGSSEISRASSEAPSRLAFAFAVVAGYGLVLFKWVSWLYEDFDPGSVVDPARPSWAPQGRGAARPMADAPKRAT